MITAQTHYRAFFDVEVAPGKSLECVDFARSVRKWITEKEGGHTHLGKAWFFNGGGWKKPEDERVHVHTASDGVVTSPMSTWSARYEHPDAEHKCRLWISDVTVQKVTEGCFRFAMHVYYRIAPGFVGEEPPLPSPGTPKLILRMLSSKDYSVTAGTSKLTGEFSNVTLGDAKALAEDILNDGRRIPYVVVSEILDGEALLDPRDLAWRLAGNASVFLVRREASDELNYFLGDLVSCGLGMVRIYQPMPRNTREDSRRHRYYLPETIGELGAEVVSGQITTGLARRGRIWVERRPGSFEDVQALIRRTRMEKLIAAAKNDSSEKGKDELIGLYEQMLKDAEEEGKNNRASMDSLETECESLRNSLDKGTSLAAHLRHRVSEVEEKLNQMTAKQAELSALDDFATLPATLEDVVRRIASIHSKTLEFTDDAVASAKGAEFSDLQTAWELLWHMGTVLNALVFKEQSKDLEASFKDKTGFDLAMTEGKMTQKDAKFTKRRRIRHNGLDYDITPHVKAEKNKRHLRVHFAINRDEGKVVIGHCGDHLETYGTKRLS